MLVQVNQASNTELRPLLCRNANSVYEAAIRCRQNLPRRARHAWTGLTVLDRIPDVTYWHATRYAGGGRAPPDSSEDTTMLERSSDVGDICSRNFPAEINQHGPGNLLRGGQSFTSPLSRPSKQMRMALSNLSDKTSNLHSRASVPSERCGFGHSKFASHDQTTVALLRRSRICDLKVAVAVTQNLVSVNCCGDVT